MNHWNADDKLDSRDLDFFGKWLRLLSACIPFLSRDQTSTYMFDLPWH